MIKVNINETEKLFTPQEISAMVLSKMKKIAENVSTYSCTSANILVSW